MKPIRPLTLLTGASLLGLLAVVVARSRRRGDDHPQRIDPGSHTSVPYGSGARIEKTFTIQRSAADLYAYWRDLTNLPHIMTHIESVQIIDERRSRWSAKGPGSFHATWDAEIIDDTPDQRIAWRSVGGSVPNAGSVAFAAAPGERGTELHVEIEWAPPGGPLGKSFASLLGGDPGLIVESDLRRFKAAMESGAYALNGTDVTR